jgi:hypothetical protein
MRRFILFAMVLMAALALFLAPSSHYVDASSHREAPLIANDPLADNTDLWVFRSPDDPNSVTIVAGYIGLELPEGGPNWTTFGENIRYEIHIKNKTSMGALGTAKDDITYRFTFRQTNEDPNTFFNIRLGQNLKTSYTCEKSVDGGASFTPIVPNFSGTVPPNNIGPRSISFTGKTYDQLVADAIATPASGEKIFCGPRDDAFFVDLGGVFDLGQTRGGTYGSDPSNSNNARDAVAGYNVHCIIMNIPISSLQASGMTVNQANGPLDPAFVIGVWASASRPRVTTLQDKGGKPMVSSDYVQVSRLGMPLTNEAVIPIKDKDYWNAVTPYSADEQYFVKYFANLELSLYMQDGSDPANPTVGLGDLVPALKPLRVQTKSYPAIGVIPPSTTPGFDFRFGKDGVFAVTRLTPPPDLGGTAFDPAVANIQPGLVGSGQPRLVDIFPIFYFGVPKIPPYQLVTGKTAGPLSPGKPFIHNFLPLTNVGGKLYGGDLLRLNMSTPVTPRGTSDYRQNAYKGLIQAAVLGLTNPTYGGTAEQAIPHMDGFPNGRRLEDDVTTIELQAVGGLVLAAVGLPFDDATAANYSDLASPKLVAELNYNAGPTANDVPLLTAFPYLANPHRGYDYVKQLTAKAPGTTAVNYGHLNSGVPKSFIVEQNYPNPFNPSTEIKYAVSKTEVVKLRVYNSLGQLVATLVDKQHNPGVYAVTWDAKDVPSGTYFYRLEAGNEVYSAKKAVVLK